MAFEIVTIPCLSDNYAFLVRGNGRTAVVDVPEAAPVEAALAARGWGLDEIWITHHHGDHIAGVDELRAHHGASVRGAAADAGRLPALDHAHGEGDSFDFAGAPVRVLEVPGHTVGHIAYYLAAAKAAFTADSLMALGCGRVFEGTMEQMWASLSKLAALPPETAICSGHEYTQSNARFALTIEPGNPALVERARRVAAARARGEPTVPSVLAEELATNPFLRAGLAELKRSLDMDRANDATVFGEIRRRKDSF